MTKYLGIDWGEKRIGLALGDSETNIAMPYKTVKNIDEIRKIIKQENIETIVIGKPLSIANSQFPISREFNKFITDFKKYIKIPIKLFDERLSSKAADKLTGGKKAKAGRDELAAMIILQSYLDLNRHEFN